MLVDPHLVETELSRLVGQLLRNAGRAADSQMFFFGGTRPSVIKFGPRKGQLGEIHDFSLHIDCDWRVRGPQGIVVGWMDMFYRAGADPDPDDSWDRHAEGAITRCDERLKAWLQHAPYDVEGVRADAVGGFTLELSGGHAIDVFPTLSFDDEYSELWRLRPPEGAHFVVSGRGTSGATTAVKPAPVR
jgi:hypothetical protein